IAGGDRGENHARATELLQFRSGILRLAVDVMMRAEFFRERFLVFAACDADGPKTHPGRVLNSKMSQPTKPQHCNDVAWPRATVAESVERRDARAHQGRAVYGIQTFRHARQRNRRRNHVFAVTAIEGNSRRLQIHRARKEIAATAVVAMAAI